MSKYLISLIATLFFVSCGANQPVKQTSNEPEVVSGTEETQTVSSGESINIESQIPYLEPQIIVNDIKNECLLLGQQFSESTAKYANRYGIRVVRNASIDTDSEGKNLKIWIKNAFSSGNAVFGHNKSVTVKAELYQNGNQIDQYSGTRHSGGGFWGSFKSSCSVLHRTVNTLGNDIAKWLRKKGHS